MTPPRTRILRSHRAAGDPWCENIDVPDNAEKDCLEQLHKGHDDAVSLAGSLSPEAYERISYCPGWTVAQVFSHLGSGAEIGLAILEAGNKQEPSPDPTPIWDRGMHCNRPRW